MRKFFLVVIAYITFCVIIATMFFTSGCMFDQVAPIFNDIDELVVAPVVTPETCDSLVTVTNPPFITGYIEITEQLATSRQIFVGPYSEWVHPANSDNLAQILDSLLTLFNPQYDYQVYALEADNRKCAVIVPGTNDRGTWNIRKSVDWQEIATRDGTPGWINLKVYMRYNGVKHFFVWGRQCFLFGGALTYNEYRQAALNFPSVNIFNFRETQYDSTDYEALAAEIKGPYWKKGRNRADFSHAIVSPETIEGFECREWQIVIP